MKVDESGGFVSLMDVPAPMPQSYEPPQHRDSKDVDEADDEDLGLGNAAPKAERKDTGKEEAEAKKKEEQNKAKEVKPMASSSWLGNLLSWRSQGQHDESKGKKAHLGEENSFYYDKERKTWVNKRAGDQGQPTTQPLAPPPKAKPKPPPSPSAGPSKDAGPGASPSKRSAPPSGGAQSSPRGPPSGAPGGPQGAKKPATGPAGLGDPPSKEEGRDGKSSAQQRATSGAAKKRPLKSRYVVVD